MCVKLRENIVNYVADHSVEVRGINRAGLKDLGNKICEEYGLDNKKCHSQVVAGVIDLYEHGKLILIGGILQVPSAEVKHRLGQHQKGVHKHHCRGGRVPRAVKPRRIALDETNEPEPELLGSEEGLKQLDSALRDVLLRKAIAEQEADIDRDDHPVLGCLGSVDDLVDACLDAYDVFLDPGADEFGENRFALIR